MKLIKKTFTKHHPHFSDELGPRFFPNPTTTIIIIKNQNQNKKN